MAFEVLKEALSTAPFLRSRLYGSTVFFFTVHRRGWRRFRGSNDNGRELTVRMPRKAPAFSINTIIAEKNVLDFQIQIDLVNFFEESSGLCKNIKALKQVNHKRQNSLSQIITPLFCRGRPRLVVSTVGLGHKCYPVYPPENKILIKGM